MEKCQKDATIIFENTDGAMYRIHRSDYDALIDACKEVESICNIPLETQVCQKIIARDVNNYINVISPDNIKFKGVFEIDRDYHKNHSKRIVPIALAEYFLNGIKPEDLIPNYIDYNSTMIVKGSCEQSGDPIYYDHHGIYDFCLGSKMKGGNKLYIRNQYRRIPKFSFEKKQEVLNDYNWYQASNDIFIKDGNHLNTDTAFATLIRDNKYVLDEELTKITRYYVSNEGKELIKKLPPLPKNKLTYTDKYKTEVDSNQMDLFDIINDVRVDAEDRESNLEVGYKCTVMNNYVDKDDYDINYDYYINETNKIINKCIGK